MNLTLFLCLYIRMITAIKNDTAKAIDMYSKPFENCKADTETMAEIREEFMGGKRK